MVGNSVKYLFFTLVLGVLLGFAFGWNLRGPVPVIVREPVTDTLRILVPVPPDVVTIEYPGLGFDTSTGSARRSAQPPGFDGAQPPDMPLDIVFVDTGGVRIDTVFVDSSFGRLRNPVFRSEKYFAFDYVESWMTAYAPVPVDSFDHQLVIDWNGFVQERVAPEMGLRLRGERRIGRFQGFVAGVVVVGCLGWVVLR